MNGIHRGRPPHMLEVGINRAYRSSRINVLHICRLRNITYISSKIPSVKAEKELCVLPCPESP